MLEARIEKTIDGTFHKTDVVTVDGREIHVSRAQKDAMADAIGRLAKADAQLVAIKIRNAAPEELAAATSERDEAKTLVMQMQSGMSQQGDAQQATRDAIRERIRAEIRDNVRDAAHD
jgi:vacuolar-type H+-ATPase subunit F/Vma7